MTISISSVAVPNGIPQANTSGNISTSWLTHSTPLALYVSPSGSDCNDGLTSSTPLLTITAALEKIGYLLASKPTINLAPGTYKEFISPYFSSSASYSVTIAGPPVGSYSIFIPTTGPQTGTFTSAAAITSIAGVAGNMGVSLRLTGAGWTPGDLVGRVVRFVSGAGSLNGTTCPVAQNTVDTIEVPLGVSQAALASTAVFSIETQAAIIQVPDAIPPELVSSGVVNALNNVSLVLQDVEVNGGITAKYATVAGDQATLNLTRCRVLGGVSYAHSQSGQSNASRFNALYCFFGTLVPAGGGLNFGGRASTGTLACCVVSPVTGTSTGYGVMGASLVLTLSGVIIQNFVSQAGVTTTTVGSQTLSSMLIRGCKHGVYVLGDSPQTLSVSNLTILNCNNHAFRSTSLSSSIVYVTGAVIAENNGTGFLFTNGHSTVTFAGTCNISNNSGWGINIVYGASTRCSHNTLSLGASVSMAGNMAGDLTLDNTTPIAISALRAAPGKRITNLDRFCILVAD